MEKPGLPEIVETAPEINYHSFDEVNIESNDLGIAWQRGGAETYIGYLELLINGRRYPLVAKACIKLLPGLVMKEWLYRRELIAEKGDYTPRLYRYSGATILEERLPYHLDEAWRIFPERRNIIGNNTQRLMNVIKELGFRPSASLERDMMTDGQRVVLVDFGSDLGSHKQ